MKKITQYDLFDEWANHKKELEPLMRTFDAINNKYGRGTIKLACGVKKENDKAAALPWELRRDYLSPCYTTNIRDIPSAF